MACMGEVASATGEPGLVSVGAWAEMAPAVDDGVLQELLLFCWANHAVTAGTLAWS